MTATLAIDYQSDGSAAARHAASILMHAVDTRGETFLKKVIRMDGADTPLCWHVELYRPFSLLSFRKKEVFARIRIGSNLACFSLTVFNSSLSDDEIEKIKDGIAELEQRFKGKRLY